MIKAQDTYEDNKLKLLGSYLQPLAKEGLETPAQCTEFLGINFPKTGTIKKAQIQDNCTQVLEYCDTIGISTLLVTDAKHFCYLSGEAKAEDSIGQVFKCCIEGYQHITVLPAISPVVVTISPSKAPLYYRAFSVLANYINGTYVVPGNDVIRKALYPTSISDIRQSLKDILHQSVLGIDIETYGDEKGDALRWERGFFGSIAFSPDKHSGVSFLVGDYFTGNDYLSIKNILKGFFDNYKGKKVLHNGLFDAKFLIRHLYMKDLGDYIGMYEGIKVFSDIDDTMIMAYACINSTERLPKGLKELSKEFTGNYAEDVKDIKLLTKENLLRYNLMDTCGTMYLYEKYKELLVQENQEQVYNSILQPSFGFLLEMMMTGLPIDRENTLQAQKDLDKIQEDALEIILGSPFVKRAESILKRLEADKYNSTHKVKQKNPDEIDLKFNPGSANQMKVLLFDILNFEVLEKTETGQPSVGGAIIKEYLAISRHNEDTDVVELLTAILDFGSAIKVNGTFINALLELSIKHPNDNWYLNGNLKMGGTQSGRLSSSEPLS